MGYRMLDLGLISQSLPPILILATRKSLSDLKRKRQIQIMKIKDTKTKVILIFAAAAAALLTGGCAEMGSGNTTSLLSAAGFRVRTPQTPQQQQIYAALPPYQVHRANVKGRTFYVYKDEKAAWLTSAGNRNTSVTTSWRFSSRLPKTTTWQRRWTVQPHLVGTELGVRELSGGETLNAKDVSFDSNSTSCWRQGTHPQT